MRVKKAQVGIEAAAKKKAAVDSAKKKAAVDSVDSEMFPGKKVAIKDIRRGSYISDNKKTADKKPVVKKKMKEGGSLKPVAADQKGLAKLPTPVRNKMGYQKDGGKLKKAKSGTAIKKKAMGGMKMMKGGGKCKYGC